MQGMRESSTVIEGKWLGSCNPGQKPADVSIPGMPNMNLKDMMKARQRNLKPRRRQATGVHALAAAVN